MMTVKNNMWTVRAVVHTLCSRILVFFVLLVWFFPMLIIFYIPTRWRFNSRLVYWLTHGWYVTLLKSTLLPITYKGREHIPNEPVIFVANHQSSLDIPLIGILARGMPHIWLARHELLQSWFLRFILPKFCIIVNVTEPKKAMRSLLHVKSLIDGQQRHLMIFPEGQRFTDGSVHEFFGGFVILAKKTGRPVVPVRIFNANKVYPPHSFLIRWHPITIVVGKPLYIQEGESDEAFKQRVYQWFEQVED